MSARIATAPSGATATPLAKPTAATAGAGGTDGSQAARSAPGSSSGAGAEGGSNNDFLTALIEAAQTDGPATTGADGASTDRDLDGNDAQAGSSEPAQSTDAARSSTTAAADAAPATSLIAPTCSPDIIAPSVVDDVPGASNAVGGGGAKRSARLHGAHDDASAASPDAVTAALLAMANALPGGAANPAARAATDSGNAPADAGGAVASSTGAPGHPAGATSSWPAAADFAGPLQRAGSGGLTGLIGDDHGDSDPGDDSRATFASNAATQADLSNLVRSLPAAASPAGPRDNTIAAPVGSDGWPRAVAAQLHWFVSNGVQSATLRLIPDHLGPIDVHVDVQQSQVNVNFNAAHPDTRAALEQSVPRLREILAGSGLTLGQANVQQQPQPRAHTPTSAVRAALAAAQSTDPVIATAPRLLGLVDEYV